jgi:hypothetical protein
MRVSIFSILCVVVRLAPNNLTPHCVSEVAELPSVSVDDVHDVINVSSAEVPDAKVLKMIKRAEVTLELETGREIHYADCLDAEKEFITVLAAVYTVCYLTGGSAVGLSFSVGDQNVSLLGKVPPLDVLQSELQRMLEKLHEPTVRRA